MICCGLRLPRYAHVAREAWSHLLAVWFVFFGTLAIYPVVLLGIEPSSAIDRSSILARYWPQLSVFLLFNATAFAGSVLAGVCDWGRLFPRLFGPLSHWSLVFSVLRAVFSIVFFMLCNYLPKDRSFPVVFSNDNIYLVVSLLFGLSSGVLSSISMMNAPKCLRDKRDAPAAGLLGSLCLTFGLVCGSFTSLGLDAFVRSFGRMDVYGDSTNATTIAFLTHAASTTAL